MAGKLHLEDWAFVSGVTAVAETRLLTNDEYLDLLRLPGLAALFQRIRQVETYVAFAPPDSPDEATRAVEREFVRHVRRFASEAPDARVCELALAGRMFGELRAFVRGQMFPGEKRGAPPIFFTDPALRSLWDGSYDAREDLAGAVARVRAALEKAADARALVDLLIDREELVYVLGLARSIGSEFIAGWAETYVRLTAALTVVRARLSGETSDRLAGMFLEAPLDDGWLVTLATADLDRLDEAFASKFAAPDGGSVALSRSTVGKIARMIDDRLTEAMMPAKCVTFGPERPFGYLWALRIENLNLRLITETFVVEGDRDEARARLRQAYV